MEVMCLKNIKKYIYICTFFILLLSCTILAIDKPDSPKGIRTIFMSNDNIYLEWDNVDDIDYYNIYESNKKNGEYKKVYKAPNNTYTIENIKPGTNMFYKITYVKDNIESKFSRIVSVDIPNINPPKSIFISTISSSAIYLRWNKTYKSDYYLIYRSSSIDGNYIQIGKTDINTYIDTGLRPITPYFYKIKVVKNGVKSGFSKVVYSTTD